jgi:hypothetical protein
VSVIRGSTVYADKGLAMFQGMKITVALMQENMAMGMHTCIADCNDTAL